MSYPDTKRKKTEEIDETETPSDVITIIDARHHTGQWISMYSCSLDKITKSHKVIKILKDLKESNQSIFQNVNRTYRHILRNVFKEEEEEEKIRKINIHPHWWSVFWSNGDWKGRKGTPPSTERLALEIMDLRLEFDALFNNICVASNLYSDKKMTQGNMFGKASWIITVVDN